MKSLFLLVAAAVADVPLMPSDYSLLCDGEQATGFNWRGGEWVETSFKPSRYIVTGSEENECVGAVAADTELEGSEGFFYRGACLSVRKFGQEYRPRFAGMCKEFYTKDGTKWLREFHCDALFTGDISGSFDGGFRRFSDSSTRKDLPQKDSLVVEVGTCARID